MIKLFNENILNITSEADYNDELIAAEDYKRSVLKTTVAINTWLTKHSKRDELRVGPSTYLSASSSHAPRYAKLPKLELKKFNGDLLMFLGQLRQRCSQKSDVG